MRAIEYVRKLNEIADVFMGEDRVCVYEDETGIHITADTIYFGDGCWVSALDDNEILSIKLNDDMDIEEFDFLASNKDLGYESYIVIIDKCKL